jgi:predicted NBD/HSP70 family sugar kinase
VLCNDADAAVWAEYSLAARPDDGPFVMLTIGTDVGGGVIVDGRLVTGANGVAGELGHLCLDPGGPVCVCGLRGCLAVYASGAAIMARARHELGAMDPDTLRLRARAGDPTASAIIADAARAIAQASAQVARVLDHRTLVLGGGAGEVLLDAVHAALLSMPPMGPIRSVPHVMAAHAGGWSGVIGAAQLARAMRADAT